MIGIIALLVFVLVMMLVIITMSPNAVGAVLVTVFFLWAVGGIVKGAADHA